MRLPSVRCLVANLVLATSLFTAAVGAAGDARENTFVLTFVHAFCPCRSRVATYGLR